MHTVFPHSVLMPLSLMLVCFVLIVVLICVRQPIIKLWCVGKQFMSQSHSLSWSCQSKLLKVNSHEADTSWHSGPSWGLVNSLKLRWSAPRWGIILKLVFFVSNQPTFDQEYEGDVFAGADHRQLQHRSSLPSLVTFLMMESYRTTKTPLSIQPCSCQINATCKVLNGFIF